MKCLDNMHWPYFVDDHDFITTKTRRKCLKSYLHFFKLSNDQTWKEDGTGWKNSMLWRHLVMILTYLLLGHVANVYSFISPVVGHISGNVDRMVVPCF